MDKSMVSKAMDEDLDLIFVMTKVFYYTLCFCKKTFEMIEGHGSKLYAKKGNRSMLY